MKRIMIGVGILAAIGAVSYLATLGCCQMMGYHPRQKGFSEQLNLSPAQRAEVASLEKSFLAQKEASCQTLCAKRAQLIQLLKQPQPDAASMDLLAEEIGREQTALEKETLSHILAVARHLEPAQREKLVALVSQELRTACKATSCGVTPGCAVTGRSRKE